MIAVGETVLSLPERALFLVLLGLVTGLALRTIYRRYRLIRRGRSTDFARENLGGRLQRFLLYVPGQWSNIRTISWRDLGGAQHLVLFWSALCLAGYYLCFVILGEGLGVYVLAPDSTPGRLYLLVTEILSLLILIALAWGVYRRLRLKPARLGPDFEENLFLTITLAAYLLLGCFFLLNGLRFNLAIASQVGPLSGLFARALVLLPGGIETQVWLYHCGWWLQAGILLCFLVYVPFSDHQHALFAPFNILLSRPRVKGGFAPVAMDYSYRGLTEAEDFTWKQLLELYGCAQCGRCQDVCPAQVAGKALSPKKIIQDLRLWLDAKGELKPFWKAAKPKDPQAPSGNPGQRVSDAELWSCTTCMACVQVCPAFVSSLDKIIDLRRERVLVQSAFYPEVNNLFHDLETFGDIFGKGRATCGDWALGRQLKELTPDNAADTLFWVGCQAAYHDRGQRSAVKLAEILTRCGVDLAILGQQESCCGDPFRRLGNEYQFQQSARRNIATLRQLNFRRIVTYCPHCYNTLKNEYPQFDGQFEVLHYTELFTELISAGTLKMNSAAAGRIAYHDPCYLARGNDLVKGQEILAALPGVTTLNLEKSGQQTFCCGGGGGAMWMREADGAKINELRVQQLMVENPEVIATSCPYCVVMLDDALKSLGLEQVVCKDLIEIVRETV